MATISTTITNGITLGTSGSYASPLTITATGAVEAASGNAIYGPGTQAWTVVNSGTVAASSYNSYGIDLELGGKVTNGASGASAALISGGFAGVNISGGAGTVANFATIAGTDSFSIGVRLQGGGGSVTNGAGGASAAVISGGRWGVTIAGGTVANSATISGSSYIGVLMNGSGSVTNGASGASALISGGQKGVVIQFGAGTVANFATIAGTSSTGVALYGGGSVTNGASGASAALISGGFRGVFVTLGGTVANFGTIAATSTSGFGIVLGAGGSVTNGASGASAALIKGSIGNQAFGVAGATVINYGRINGTGTTAGSGVYFNNTVGVLTNHTGGIITGVPSGVLLGGTTSAAATVSNAGTISGSIGVAVSLNNTGNNTIVNSGTITGTAGTAVQLGAGNDKVIVQPGAVFNGKVQGGAGTDTLAFTKAGAISLAKFAGFETIKLSSTGTNTLTLTNANFTGVTGASIQVFGGAAGNTVNASALTGANRLVFTGGGGADAVAGGAGADTLNGGAGADTMAGGLGNDTYFVDNAGDVVTENAGQGTDTVKTTAASYSLGPNVEKLVFIGSGNFAGTGNILNNIITGGAGNDTLTGGAGNDTLGGGPGNDSLTGGTGQDAIRFDRALNAATNVDQIFNFSSIDDKILLSQAVFIAAGAVGTLAAGAFRIGAGAADAGDRIIYTSGTGALRYDFDGTGAAAATQFATLSTGLALTNANFQIV